VAALFLFPPEHGSPFPPEKYFRTRGVIGRTKTPWTGDTPKQALVAKENENKKQRNKKLNL